jgi:carbamate kinase
MIQQSLQNALTRAGVARDVITVITQTIVDEGDPLLRHPDKPIGHPLDARRRKSLELRGVAMAKDIRGRPRRLAASPIPLGIVEAAAVRRLVDAGTIVIACGGGGPPVYRDARLGWEGVDAVVDKDRTAAMLAEGLEADFLLILTDAEGVYRDFGTDHATLIQHMSVAEARALLAAEGLGAGSMRPKVEAALQFVERTHGRAAIAALRDGPAAMRSEAGTTIADASPGAS